MAGQPSSRFYYSPAPPNFTFLLRTHSSPKSDFLLGNPLPRTPVPSLGRKQEGGRLVSQAESGPGERPRVSSEGWGPPPRPALTWKTSATMSVAELHCGLICTARG